MGWGQSAADFGISSDDQLFDTDTNFRAAKRISDQQGIGAWGACTNGSYKYLGKDSAGGAPVKAGDAGPNAALSVLVVQAFRLWTASLVA